MLPTATLGNSNLSITRIGLGAWAIGGGGWEFSWGPQDDQASIETIHRAIDLGINWIDTAAVYGVGHSEEVIASALAGWSGKRPLLFTKCGLVTDSSGTVSKLLTPASIRKECEESLRRLKVDAIDLYQIHKPPSSFNDIRPAWETMARLKEEGKVKWIGVSSFDVRQLKEALSIAPITSAQPRYSLIDRSIEQDVLPFCQQHNLGVIVYSPMGSGLLTGSFSRQRLASLPSADWRKTAVQFSEPNLSRNLALAETLRGIASKHGFAPGEAAIAWTLLHPAVTGAIVGARSADQVEGFIRAPSLRLSLDDVQLLQTAS